MSVWRVAILVTVLVALVVAAELSGVRARLSLEGVRTLVASAGVAGMLLFLATFSAGLFMQIPGTIFVAAAVLSWGRLSGGILAWVGAVAAVSATFVVVRTVGGRAPAEVRNPRVEKLLAMLNARPIRTVIVLRVVFWMSPLVNYALAMSRLRFRDYAIGSAVGLLGPVGVVALFTERVLAYLTR